MNIGKSIRVYMAKTDITRTQIAERMGVTESWISMIKHDPKLGLNRVEEIANIFGASTSEFIKAGEEESNNGR